MRFLILLLVFALFLGCAPVGKVEKTPDTEAVPDPSTEATVDATLQTTPVTVDATPTLTDSETSTPSPTATQTFRSTPLPPVSGLVDFNRYSYILNEDSLFVPENTERVNVTLSFDGRNLAVTGATSQGNTFLHILDTQTNELITSIPIGNAEVYSLSFFPNGDKLVYATNNPFKVVVWDVDQQEVEQVLWEENRDDSLPIVAVSPDGEHVAVAFGEQLLILEASGSRAVINKPGFAITDINVRLPKYSRDGLRLAVFTDNRKTIVVYDTATWNPVKVIEYTKRSAMADFSADGQWLATAEFFATNAEGFAPVLLLNVDTLEQFKLVDKMDYIGDIAFAPDDSGLLVGGHPEISYSGDLEGLPVARYLSVWETATQQRLGDIPLGNLDSSSILYSQDGTSILLIDKFGYYYHVFRAEPAIMATARAKMLDLDKALRDKDYEFAATLIDPYQPTFLDLYLEQGEGELPLEKRAQRLEALCNLDNQPCSMPLRRIFLGTYEEEFGICSFEVQLTAPDGSLFEGQFGSLFTVLLACENPDDVFVIEHPIFTLTEDTY